MAKLLCTTAAVAILATAAFGQSPQGTPSGSATSATNGQQTLTAIPANSTTVTNYYKQNIYDTSNNKVGEVNDVLVDRQGKVTALIVGVGGIAGAGQKDVAVPFESVRLQTQDANKWRLVMNATSDSLKGATGYKYDRSNATWTLDTK